MPATIFAASDNILSKDFSYSYPPTDMTVGEGVTIQFKKLSSGVSFNDLKAVSSDTSVVTLALNGTTGLLTLKAVGEGTAKITFGANGYADDVSYIDVISDDAYDDEEVLPAEILDLQDYADMLQPIEVYETNALTAYQKNMVVTASNRKTVYSTLTNVVIPNYKKVVNMVSKVKAPNAELQSIHALMVKGSQLQLEGFTLMQQAIYKKQSLTAANKKLEAGRTYINQYTTKLNAYVNKYNQ
ncbi:hypothetical protein [Paenibacillus dendrobii]|nr:hypothetical protein [Paenibacillus dendrobii]